MSFGSRLRQRREELGLKQSELGKMLGISGSAIGNYETGFSSPKADILYKVFDVLDCDANFLFQDEMTMSDDDVTVEEMEHIKKYRALDKHGKDVVDMLIGAESTRLHEDEPVETKLIPLFGQSLAAGSGEPDFGGAFFGDYEVPSDSKAEFACRIHGDSLEPFYRDGDTALAMRRLPQDGEVGAFYVDGEYKVKQFASDGIGNVYLFALNRDRADTDQTLWASEEHTVSCLGTLIMSRRPLPR